MRETIKLPSTALDGGLGIAHRLDDRLETSMTDGPAVLVVEDDRNLNHLLVMALESDGYQTIESVTGRSAIEEVRIRNPDLILLDLGLPDIDGLALVPTIRANSAAPIIVVSGRGEEAEKVKALDAGANDYLTKPFSVPELRARMRATLRDHVHVANGTETTIVFGQYTLDFLAQRLMRGKSLVHLSPTEFRLLATLARHAGRPVTTDALLRETWGAAYQRKNDYVRVYMHSLRAKVEPDPTHPQFLLNEAGFGYRLNTSGG
jgi:two-component system KDP operon response regulator KdpE